MKTKQTKIDRSAAKWLPGAMALAATTASSQAATVQITLTGNKISSTGNQLVADLTGDNVGDLVLGVFRSSAGYVQVDIGDGVLRAGRGLLFQDDYFVDAVFGDSGRWVGEGFDIGGGVRSIYCLNPIMFTDSRINDGLPTGGWLEVNAFNTDATNHTVELTRLIFDTESTTLPGFSSIPGVQTVWVAAVPEPGSNLALLALGAGGLTLRRRLKRAA